MSLITYMNYCGNSGINAFASGPGSIRVRFENGLTYLYDTTTNERSVIEQMKQLARKGSGLNAFINHNKPSYTRC